MRALLINSVCGIRSTGRICTQLAENLEEQGYEVKIAYGREQVPKEYVKYAVRIGNTLDPWGSALHTRLTDKHGFSNRAATKRFLLWAEEYNPELLWLHNLHGYYINIEMLFEWIKSRPHMKIRWTLHDCWAFTGHCAYFSKIGCNKWITKCEKCNKKKSYPISYLCDNSAQNYIRKKELFTGVNNMTLITPSKWLSDLVKKSFLKEYPVEVIYNTIDTKIFQPRISNFKEQYNLLDKKILLGVASAWNERKGFEDFIKLASLIDKDYVIVLVGLSKKQLKHLPNNIIGIQRTNNAKELAEIYTVADVFLNLTYEDNYPTVNLEAQACGTPVITYRTGGSVESVPEENIVEQGNVFQAYKRAIQIIEHKNKIL